MKIDNNLIQKSIFDNVFLKKTDFESEEEVVQAAYNQRDSFEYIGIKKSDICDQYNDLRHKLVRTGDARLSISSDIQKSMLDCLEKYYEGKGSDEELTKAYIGYCEQIGTVGKTRLLDMYENFLNMSRYAANNVCGRKGNEITVNYGNIDEHDAVYYNADFYYAFDRVKEIAREASDKIAEVMSFDKLDFEEREECTIFNLDGEFSFNGKWAWNARNLMNRCSMIDTDMVPPKGFEFYYKERKYSDSEVGVILVGIKKKYKEVEVPFKEPKAGGLGCVQKFNASELCRITKDDTDEYKNYNDFIRTFDIYTRYYFANSIEKN